MLSYAAGGTSASAPSSPSASLSRLARRPVLDPADDTSLPQSSQPDASSARLSPRRDHHELNQEQPAARTPNPTPIRLNSTIPDQHRSIEEYHSAFHSSASAYGELRPSPSLPPPHRRQNSVPSLLPLALINRATSPERRQRPWLADMPYTGEGRRNGRSSDAAQKSSGIASWFTSNNNSSPSNGQDGFPSPNSLNDRFSPNLDATSAPRYRGSTPSEGHPSPASSRFAFLTSGMSALTSALTNSPSSPSPRDHGVGDDELLNLNVEAALFPSGPPTDTFSPAAFKNLQVTAVALARRLQNAYREQARAAHDLAAERAAEADEMEEATTRATHLKMQLEDMALKAADQERAMRELLTELDAERRKTAKLLAGSQGSRPAAADGQTVAASEGSISEDLGVDAAEEERQRRLQKWRGSGVTINSFDTDDDSLAENESVFSRSRSPTATDGPTPAAPAAAAPRSPSSTGTTLVLPATTKSSLKPPATKGTASPRPQQPPMSTFQKLVKNVTSTAASPDSNVSPSGCGNCMGQAASVAWDTVGLLRDENRALKQRVGDLEVAVEGALDLVNGVGL